MSKAALWQTLHSWAQWPGIASLDLRLYQATRDQYRRHAHQLLLDSFEGISLRLGTDRLLAKTRPAIPFLVR